MEQHINRPKRQFWPLSVNWDALPTTARLVTILVLFGLATATQAVTLGQVKVSSYLNQPLEAEIDLIGVASGQHEDLRIRIANQDQFGRLGIAYTRLLSDLKFDVVQSSGRWIVRIRSNQPVNEPFLDFPVQLSWPGGQMVRQYTLLLDPLTLTRPATVSRAAAPPPAPARQTQAAPRSAPRPPAGATYGPVRRGETLWPIAQKLKPSGITTQQMAMALLRANPQAFIDNNVNKLRAGAVLTVPPLGAIQQLDAASAQREFAEQTRQWRAPVATSPREVIVAPGTADTPAEPTDKPSATATAVESDPTPTATDVDETDDQLRIVSKEEADAASEDAAIQKQLMVTMEEIESNRITTTAIESRLAKLEQELSKMQALVELKDQQIKALQSEIDARDAIEKAAEAADAELPPATGPTESAPPAAIATAPEPAPDAAEPVADAPVAIATETVPTAEPSGPPWQEQYPWLMWAVLGLVGLVVVTLLVRRQTATQEQSNVPMADLPSTMPPTYVRAREPAREEIRQAERDFRDLAKEPAPDIEPATAPAEPLPEMNDSEAKAVVSEIEDLTQSLLDESLDRGQGLESRPTAKASEFKDEEIANWVEELGSEIDQLDLPEPGETPTTEKPAKPPASDVETIDDDIPTLLNELDGQLSSTDSTVTPSATNIQLDPIDEPVQLDALNDDQPTTTAEPIVEDDTFTMSLDLARAYLEIGDNDGARDMLKQALAGARNPDHRRQIEELLQQIH